MGGAVSAGEDNDDLIDKLVAADYIKSKPVERVFRAVDRSYYYLLEHRHSAYEDLAWKHGHLHLSAPCIYSEVMETLELKEGLSFLNLGSGTGYLSTMVGLILGPYGVNHGVEIHEDVVEYAYDRLTFFQQTCEAFDEFEFCEPHFVVGNCLLLSSDCRLYDRVYCGAACPPEHENYMKNMLTINGLLVMPLNDKLVQIRRLGESTWETNDILPVTFASLTLPTKETGFDMVKLPDVLVPSLQEACRICIRRILRSVIEIEHPDKKPRPVKRPKRTRCRQRMINIMPVSMGMMIMSRLDSSDDESIPGDRARGNVDEKQNDDDEDPVNMYSRHGAILEEDEDEICSDVDDNDDQDSDMDEDDIDDADSTDDDKDSNDSGHTNSSKHVKFKTKKSIAAKGHVSSKNEHKKNGVIEEEEEEEEDEGEAAEKDDIKANNSNCSKDIDDACNKAGKETKNGGLENCINRSALTEHGKNGNQTLVQEKINDPSSLISSDELAELMDWSEVPVNNSTTKNVSMSSSNLVSCIQVKIDPAAPVTESNDDASMMAVGSRSSRQRMRIRKHNNPSNNNNNLNNWLTSNVKNNADETENVSNSQNNDSSDEEVDSQHPDPDIAEILRSTVAMCTSPPRKIRCSSSTSADTETSGIGTLSDQSDDSLSDSRPHAELRFSRRIIDRIYNLTNRSYETTDANDGEYEDDNDDDDGDKKSSWKGEHKETEAATDDIEFENVPSVKVYMKQKIDKLPVPMALKSYLMFYRE